MLLWDIRPELGIMWCGLTSIEEKIPIWFIRRSMKHSYETLHIFGGYFVGNSTNGRDVQGVFEENQVMGRSSESFSLCAIVEMILSEEEYRNISMMWCPSH